MFSLNELNVFYLFYKTLIFNTFVFFDKHNYTDGCLISHSTFFILKRNLCFIFKYKTSLYKLLVTKLID